MAKKINNTEKKLHELWLAQEFNGKLRTLDGKDIEVLSPGEENIDKSGPDFHNAKIRIDSLVFVGDVEIDVDYSGWKHHGHNIDKHYNSVILHVVFENKNRHQYVYTKGGRKVPVLALKNFISKDYLNALKNQELTESNPKVRKLKCEEGALTTDYFLRERFIAELGLERFANKIKRMERRLKELKFLDDNKISEPKINFALPPEYDVAPLADLDLSNKRLWEQLFYEFLFEALGYTQNKTQMMKLARLANLDFLEKIADDENYLEKLHAVLYKIAGLFIEPTETDDEEMTSYQRKLAEYWNDIKNLYDSEFLSETDWHFFRMRPQNFPTIRIAAGAFFIKEILKNDFISRLIKLFQSDLNNKKLISKFRTAFIVKSYSVWKKHFTFYKKAKTDVKYFVGLSRADEIIANVLLPFLALYFKVFNLSEDYKKVLKLFNLYEQKNDYALVNDIAKTLGLQNLTHRTIFAQGILHLYRNYCSRNLCLECRIGKELFE